MGAPIEVRTKLTYHLGVLGITGLTAWFGLLGVTPPLPGDTVVISSAAGAVGHIAGQLARIAGARVVALSSSDQKNAWLCRELGFEAAVNYRSPTFSADLQAACPHGVDVFFDLVGGAVLETVLTVMNEHGRVSGSGFIAQYSSDTLSGPANLPAAMIVKRLKMQGFTVTDAVADWPEAERRLAVLIEQGRLQPIEEIVEGLENSAGCAGRPDERRQPRQVHRPGGARPRLARGWRRRRPYTAASASPCHQRPAPPATLEPRDSTMIGLGGGLVGLVSRDRKENRWLA